MRVMQQQREYMLNNNVKHFRQLLITGATGVVFATQFLAIKKMAAADFPGFTTGGTLWFHDLTAADPLFLPLISALTALAVFRVCVVHKADASTDEV